MVVATNAIEVNGTTLYYDEAGKGQPMLFIHGMCGDAGTWADQLRRLSTRFRCIAYDRRGHTRSPLGQIEQRRVELHADDAAGLIAALDLAPCIIVGSSSGARITLDVVRRYPRFGQRCGPVGATAPVAGPGRQQGVHWGDQVGG